MYDFLKISTKESKNKVVIEPKFVIGHSSDLMIRGGDFYAVWQAEEGLWSTNELDVVKGVDRDLHIYYEEVKDKYEVPVVVKYMWDGDSGSIDKWHKFCQKQARDHYHQLDEKLIFSNMEITKEDYASKRLSYPLAAGDCTAWDRLISTLYSPEERHKIEWAIGAIVSGDSKDIEKFMVLYGSAGTGKGTILKIIAKMFDGYCSTFEAKVLGSSQASFALEQFRDNPLVAIQFDGKLNKIEDNTRINSLVSHEPMTMNVKFQRSYTTRFNAFLFMGTNSPVQITDAKSGLLRRLIDVTPTGNKIPFGEYNHLKKQVNYELGAIAQRCLDIYLEDPGFYNNYVPTNMMSATNDFFNFVDDSYAVFKNQDGTTAKAAWDMYKVYCEDAKVPYPYSMRVFKEELRNYFEEVKERYTLPDGTRVRNYYLGFLEDKFRTPVEPVMNTNGGWIELKPQDSLLDSYLKGEQAQYAKEDGTPNKSWDKVKTNLSDINTMKLHYVRCPLNLICIDFDISDKSGNKNMEKNLEAANKWPATYTEVSQGGNGLHLHYLYSGDPTQLSRVFDDQIEVKVYSGKSSLRRKLTLCNDIPIATISSGLPLKEKKVVNYKTLEDEKHIRCLIKKALFREIHPNTKPSIDFILMILEEAYNSGMVYDVSDLYQAVLNFALESTHQKDICLKMVAEMHFNSVHEPEDIEVPHDNEGEIVFFDVEVFPNLFLVCWKIAKENYVYTMINPGPQDVAKLFKYRLIGFNNRRYDNHILYACYLGYSVDKIYELSNRIINGDKDINPFFKDAYNISYTDIYDFSSVKMSLKKFEIELGIHHQELGLPWDEPVSEDLWETVADYCKNDVVATEVLFYSKERRADWTARQILADIAGMTPNDTTNSLTTRFIFGNDRHPQLNYRDLGDTSDAQRAEGFDEYTLFDSQNRPVFPGYTYGLYSEDGGKPRMMSRYRGQEVGEGGCVYAEPGIYWNTKTEDIASMHPTSAVCENYMGKYTERFNDILEARLAIKHKDFDKAKTLLNGQLAPYLTDESSAKALAKALKIAINSVYGLTSAKFDNPFRDSRNVDNIIAKRGSLFMINLRHEVQKRGFQVAHVKTDSIKVVNPTDDIIKFIEDYGKMYGYTFEQEADYERICLINDAVYIAKYSMDPRNDRPGEWTATGKQFQVPYVFKTLFSKEPIEFDDMCVTNSVKTAMYLDMNCSLDGTNRDLRFVGKVGQFVPVKPGCGGILLRKNTDKNGNVKYDAVAGSKGYFWQEAEAVRGKDESIIERGYFNHLVDEALNEISKYGDAEEFLA